MSVSNVLELSSSARSLLLACAQEPVETYIGDLDDVFLKAVDQLVNFGLVREGGRGGAYHVVTITEKGKAVVNK